MIRNFEVDNLAVLRKKLLAVEGKCSTRYFSQVFGLFNEAVKPSNRKTFKAYDGLNNLFNLAYTLLFWKCYRALIKSHLESYLGFLHSLKFRRPALVCDFIELYRYLADDFLIMNCQKLKPEDFTVKAEEWAGKKSKRIYLKKSLADELTGKLHDHFMRMVRVPRIMRGSQQELETLINEEALLLAKYIRCERREWSPRIARLD